MAHEWAVDVRASVSLYEPQQIAGSGLQNVAKSAASSGGKLVGVLGGRVYDSHRIPAPATDRVFAITGTSGGDRRGSPSSAWLSLRIPHKEFENACT